MDAFCEICGKQWPAGDPGVRYVPGYGIWLCAEEPACFARVAGSAGWCGVPGPDGLACQRPAHDNGGHAAVREW